MSEQQIEKEIIKKGLTAPRLTPKDIDDSIRSVHYFSAAQGVAGATGLHTDVITESNPECLNLLTFCVLVLKNGFTVTGESACASPENFNAEIGQKIAKEQARNKIWMLEGYLLKEKLFSLVD